MIGSFDPFFDEGVCSIDLRQGENNCHETALRVLEIVGVDSIADSRRRVNSGEEMQKNFSNFNELSP